jgi:3D (Asp-Asp-Asp) domain-containing protein
MNNKITFKKIIISAAFLLFASCFFFPVIVQANASLPDLKMPNLQIKIPGINFTSTSTILSQCDVNEKGEKTKCYFPWIAEYIVGIYKYAVGIVGILAAVVLMWGGIVWLTAGGNQQRVSEAKTWIGASITGLVILLTSYIILYQINPDLVGFKSLAIKIAIPLEQYIENRSNGTTNAYKNTPCTGLTQGNDYKFYLTGYIKYPHNDNSLKTRCMIALNCYCPNDNKRTSEDCSAFYSSSSKHPCASFNLGDPYCTSTASGKTPKPGTLAADLSCFEKGKQQMCIDGKTYTVEDSGGDISGMRLDVWSDNVNDANGITGEKTIKLGPCQ